MVVTPVVEVVVVTAAVEVVVVIEEVGPDEDGPAANHTPSIPCP